VSAYRTLPGDVVRCTNLDNLNPRFSPFTVGKLYIVGGIYYDSRQPTRVFVDVDDRGKPNGWGMEKFELVKRGTGKISHEIIKQLRFETLLNGKVKLK
jgi:myo-inositol-hexaphosphate 3-phosphohydrolase